MAINVFVYNDSPIKRLPYDKVKDAVERALKEEKIDNAEINVIFVDDTKIVKLNKEFLRHNYPTDVISFPLGNAKQIEGEIYISAETAKLQAKEYGVTLSNEVVRLAVHGTLHLIGYDDATPEQRIVMHDMENRFIGS